MHLSRNCSFSNKTNLHLELPGRIADKHFTDTGIFVNENATSHSLLRETATLKEPLVLKVHCQCSGLCFILFLPLLLPTFRYPLFTRERKKTININSFGRTVSGTNRNRPWDNWDPSPGQNGTRPWDKPAFLCLIPQ